MLDEAEKSVHLFRCLSMNSKVFLYIHFAHFAWLKMLQSNGHKGTEMFCICLFKDGVTIIGNITYLAIQIRDWSLNSRCILSDVLANYWAVQTLYSSKMPPLRKTTDFLFFFTVGSMMNDVQTCQLYITYSFSCLLFFMLLFLRCRFGFLSRKNNSFFFNLLLSYTHWFMLEKHSFLYSKLKLFTSRSEHQVWSDKSFQ